MLVICDDESDPQGPREIARRPDHVAWIDYLRSHEVKLLGGERLRPSGDATSVRARGGEVLISDGPYTETKEQIGGFALIECVDLDHAIEVAARHPFAAHGVIEIRPVWEG
jgi:hypothetical protein